MKLQRRYYLIALLFMVGLFIIKAGILRPTTVAKTEYDLNKSIQNSDLVEARQAQNPIHQDQPLKNSLSEFNRRLKRESIKAGKIDESPQKTEQELFEFSQKLSLAELKQLKELAVSVDGDGDERSLAAYLLSLNRSKESIAIVEDIVLQSVPDLHEPRRNDFEYAVRAQILENLEANPHQQETHEALNQIVKRSESTFLVDRAQRIRSYRSNKTPSLKEQDLEALKKIAR